MQNGVADMTSRRARERANARPWEQGEAPEDDERHAGDFPEYEPEQHERCPDTDDMFGDE